MAPGERRTSWLLDDRFIIKAGKACYVPVLWVLDGKGRNGQVTLGSERSGMVRQDGCVKVRWDVVRYGGAGMETI